MTAAKNQFKVLGKQSNYNFDITSVSMLFDVDSCCGFMMIHQKMREQIFVFDNHGIFSKVKVLKL